MDWEPPPFLVIGFFLVLLFGIPVGAFLLIFSFRRWRQRKLARLAKQFALTQPGPQPRTLKISRQPLPFVAVFVDRPSLFNALAGAFLLLGGLAAYAYTYVWMDTRIFVPVDRPVPMQSGHIRTGPFRINLNGYYLIWLQG